MRKLLFIALLVLGLGISCGISYSADWNEYESGRNNIRLDGYDGQPGYIAFTDGDGTVLGYLFASEKRLKWISVDAIDLDTTKLDGADGSNISLGSDQY